MTRLWPRPAAALFVLLFVRAASPALLFQQLLSLQLLLHVLEHPGPAFESGAPIGEEGVDDAFEVVHEILNTGEGFQLHIPDDVANFTEYAPGTVIWDDPDTCYRVGERPEAIVFPNREVPVGQRAGLMIRARD